MVELVNTKKKIVNKLYYYLKLYKYIDQLKFNDSNKIFEYKYGHARSRELKLPVGENDQAIPWFTYPAIEYISQLNLTSLSILEWGLGNSTLYFSNRCKEILSVEHNKDWYDSFLKKLPSNASAVLKEEDKYSSYPLELSRKFDIIIVDGIFRWECILTALKVIKDGGMIIFDNSDRNPEYCEYLRNQDFIQIDFHGFCPIVDFTTTTTIFFSRNFTVNPLTVQPRTPIGGGF
jgi:hypothetical protein